MPEQDRHLRVYVQQYDAFWSLTLPEWKKLVSNVVWGSGEYNLDEYKSVRKPGSVHRSTSGGWWISTHDHWLRQPLDWTPEDWVSEASALGLKPSRGSSGSTPPTPPAIRNATPRPSRPAPPPGAQRERSDSRSNVGLTSGSAPPSYELPLENSNESEEDARRRIKARFVALEHNAHSVVSGAVPSLIVSGPPGIGKSFEFREQLNKSNLMFWLEVEDQFNAAQDPALYAEQLGVNGFYDTISGTISAVGLYQALWNMRAGGVLLLDDVDDVFRNETALNILKAALDSDKNHRLISWRKDARWLEELGIPRTFRFEGQIGFLTNIDFEQAIAKHDRASEHLKALLDRSRYLSLTLRTQRDFMIRIRMVSEGPNGMLRKEFGLTDNEVAQVLDFVDENKTKFYNLSLRLVGQCATELKADPKHWKNNIIATKMRTM